MVGRGRRVVNRARAHAARVRAARAGRTARLLAAGSALSMLSLSVAVTGAGAATTLGGLETALCAGGGETVALTGDLGGDTLTIGAGCTAVLDLDGWTLTVQRVHLNAESDLTIRDTSADATGELVAAPSDGTAAIRTTGATLRIQSGTVRATGGQDGAGIGGSFSAGGTVIIDGGTVIARGGGSAAGIGGGNQGAGGTVLINGGTVTATGATTGGSGAGIGGGGGGGAGTAGGTVTINGGTVTATAGGSSPGIGGGDSADGGIITITGGTVIATAGSESAGIGGGPRTTGLTVAISGGSVTATGGTDGPGIGTGAFAIDGGTVTISGGIVTATAAEPPSGAVVAPIGAGRPRSNGSLTFNDVTVTIVGDPTDATEGRTRTVTFPPALSLVTPPSGAVVGAPLGVQPVVGLVDAAGVAVVQSGVEVSVAVASGPGSLDGVTSVETGSDGLAVFSGLSIDAEGEHTLVFTADGLEPVTSGTVLVGGGAVSDHPGVTVQVDASPLLVSVADSAVAFTVTAGTELDGGPGGVDVAARRETAITFNNPVGSASGSARVEVAFAAVPEALSATSAGSVPDRELVLHLWVEPPATAAFDTEPVSWGAAADGARVLVSGIGRGVGLQSGLTMWWGLSGQTGAGTDGPVTVGTVTFTITDDDG